LGFGGSCLPKDVKALISELKRLHHTSPLLKAVLQINEAQASRAVKLALEELGSLKRKRVAVLGLSFKSGTDDMREARSIMVINELLKLRAEVTVYDPAAMENARQIFRRKITYATSERNCIEGTDCCIVATEWEEFKKLTAEDFLSVMRTPVVIDGRRVYDPSEFAKKLKYRAIGLASPVQP
jgi:UDPglucose 6-dehydrogenase